MHTQSPWRAVLSATCTSLIGIGLARFAYTPLLPAIIAAGWFTPGAAAYLGAANLTGYLAGALLAWRLTALLPVTAVLRAMMVLATLTFFTSAWPVDFAWFFAWRFASGFAGGALMVLAAPTVLPFVAASRRGLASGAIFTGVGLGIAISGTLVPLLLHDGLTWTWCGLGLVSLLLTAIGWNGWPQSQEAGATAMRGAIPLPRRTVWTLRSLIVEYSLNAAGLVPHMLFLVAYVARGLGQGVQVGAHYWVLFGIGAAVGPMLAGQLADRVGFTTALRIILVLQIVGVAATMLGPPVLIVSSVVVGALTPGIVPIVLGRFHELLAAHPVAQKLVWSRATIGYALLQAVSAYAMSFLSTWSGGYTALFLAGAIIIAISLVIELGVGAALARAP